MDNFAHLPHFYLPEKWDSSLRKILEEGGKIMLIGGVDSGKTTLARYLLWELLRKREREIAFLDTDVGQSILGPPSTLGMGIFDKFPQDWEKILPWKMWFVGTVSPSGFLLEVITGSKKMLEEVESSGIRDVIIDTCGMVSGWEGVRLKFFQIKWLTPDHIILLERGEELKELKDLIKVMGGSFYHLQVGPWVKERKREERRNYRKLKFKQYFQGSEEVSIEISQVAILNSCVPWQENLLLGLSEKKGFSLGLGLFKKREKNRITFLTPLKNLERIKIIQAGTLRINPKTGEEE